MSVEATVALQRQRGQSRVMVAYMRRVGDHLADIKSLLEVEERDRAKQRRLVRLSMVQEIDEQELQQAGVPDWVRTKGLMYDERRLARAREELALFDDLWPEAKDGQS